MKFYIASPWQNKDEVKALTEALITRGHTAYSFFNNGANPVGGMPIVETSEESGGDLQSSVMNWENNPVIKEIFDFNMQALRDSDAVILLEPSGRSSLAEAGIAFGMGKKIVLVGHVAHPEVVVYCICESRYPSIEEFLSGLDHPAA
jgi:hypothetical protein